MRKCQLCMTKGGIHPGEGCFGGICVLFFFFLTAERLFLVRLLVSFLLQRIKFQRKDQTTPWWDEMVVEDIFGIRGMFATLLGLEFPNTMVHRDLTKYSRAKSSYYLFSSV